VARGRYAGGVSYRAVFFRLVRSGAAGVLATAADLGTLTMLVSIVGISALKASVPALIAGSIVMFIGHKYFVFGAHAASTLWRETLLFTIIQIGGIALSAWLFQVLLGVSPRLLPFYVVVRLAANNIVWLLYYFPLWHFVFKSPAKPA
jgi:putative flippase GtrA